MSKNTVAVIALLAVFVLSLLGAHLTIPNIVSITSASAGIHQPAPSPYSGIVLADGDPVICPPTAPPPC